MNWSGYGYVFWLRRSGIYEPVNGLWKNAGYVAKGWKTPGNELFETISQANVHFNMSGFMSRDCLLWSSPAGSPIIHEFANFLIDKTTKKE